MNASFYGLDHFTLSPPWSLLISVSILLGIICPGFFLIKYISFKQNNAGINLKAITLGPIFSLSIIGPLLYPILLFGTNPVAALKSLAYGLAFTGGCFLIYALVIIKNKIDRLSLKNSYPLFTSNNLLLGLLGVLLFGHCLLSLSPPTDADALDYHLGVPLALLESGAWINSPEWFHSRLAGLGESFIALGLSVGAEQFGSLLQFCGLIAIINLIIQLSQKFNRASYGVYCALAITSSPIILWLTSTPKPMLMPIAMTTVSAMLLIQPLKDISKNSNTNKLINYLIINLLLMNAALMKFNFILSAILIGSIALFNLYQSKLLDRAILITTLLAVLIIVPPSLWKWIHFGGSWFEGIYLLFPGKWPGYANFESLLRNFTDTNIYFPISLIYVENLGEITTVLGIGVIIWLIGLIWTVRQFGPFNNTLMLIISSATLATAGGALGQTSGRFYLEPLIWMVLAISSGYISNGKELGQVIRIAILIQSAVAVAGITFCVYELFPGSISNQLRNAVMIKHAYQYSEIKWLGTTLPLDAVVLSELRSKSLSPRKTISLDWTDYIHPKEPEAMIYLNLIQSQAPTHLLTYDPINSKFTECINGKLIGPFQSIKASRNPFNSTPSYQNTWLAPIDGKNLISCSKD